MFKGVLCNCLGDSMGFCYYIDVRVPAASTKAGSSGTPYGPLPALSVSVNCMLGLFYANLVLPLPVFSLNLDRAPLHVFLCLILVLRWNVSRRREIIGQLS